MPIVLIRSQSQTTFITDRFHGAAMPITTCRLTNQGIFSLRGFVASACLLALTASSAWCQARSPKEAKAGSAAADLSETKGSREGGETPFITVAYPNLEHFYSDLNLMFNLVGEQKRYQTLKGTLDEFVVGVDPASPGGVHLYATPDGLQTVISLPIKHEADFNKFVENLYDLDVKTYPPPKSVRARQLPKSVRDRTKTQKLEADERIIYGLQDGYLKHVPGMVLMGDSLERLRAVKGGLHADQVKTSLSVLINGQAASPELRRQAFKKTREKWVADLKKWEKETDAEFSHRRAITEEVLTDLADSLAETSHSRADLTISHEKKNSHLAVEMKADEGSSLAGRIERIGKTPDEFAGVSREGCVASLSINSPLDQRGQESMRSIARHGRASAKERIQENASSDSKAAFHDFNDLICDITEDVAGLPEFNACRRVWSDKSGNTLTTVGAVKVADTSRVIEFLQKLKSHAREGETVRLKVASEGSVAIHHVANPRWQKDYPELFDDEGSVYIGTGEKAVWYALGQGSLDRLKEAISQASQKGAKAGPGDLEARLYPLAEVWDKIRSRQKANGPGEKVSQIREQVRENRPKVADTARTIRDMHLSKLAVEAFKNGQDSISMKVSGKGDTLTLTGDFDEGTLRFVGKALAKFVKDNLED
jgi:hypothetical protein